MPCSSPPSGGPDYRARESHRVAGHLLYISGLLGEHYDDHDELQAAAKDIYGKRAHCDLWTARLCDLMRAMGESERERIVYNAHDGRARDLASWWENHQIEDARREVLLANSALRRATKPHKGSGYNTSPTQEAHDAQAE